MYIILGTLDCRYCYEAKELLKERNIYFECVNLRSVIRNGWRNVFTILKDHLKGQTTIPIILYTKGYAPIPTIDENLFKDGKWKMIGTFEDLKLHVDDPDKDERLIMID